MASNRDSDSRAKVDLLRVLEWIKLHYRGDESKIAPFGEIAYNVATWGSLE